MNSIGAEQAFDLIMGNVNQFKASQMPLVKQAAKLLSNSLLQDGVIHVFGAGHSRTFGMEMCGRSGGLVPLNLVGLEDLSGQGATEGITLIDLERDPQTAHRLMDMHDVRSGDAFIIVSNSGRNGSSVELALECKSRGVSVIVVTSMQHSSNVTSRHPGGLKLYEVADCTVDNCCPYGDTLIEIPGMEEKTGSASTVVGAFIAQLLTAEIIGHYLNAGKTPPVYISANVDGGDEHNSKLQQLYSHRKITY